MGWRERDGQNSITEDSCTASPHYLTPYQANDITISCKGCSHYPPSSTNRRNISACLFQPTRNTDMTQTANSSFYCRYGNCILSSLLPWGASFNSITELEEMVSQLLCTCKSVLRPTIVCLQCQIMTRSLPQEQNAIRNNIQNTKQKQRSVTSQSNYRLSTVFSLFFPAFQSSMQCVFYCYHSHQ